MSLNVYTDWLGIPEENCPPDYYALLRLVQFEDDTERIQANYRKLNVHVRKYATGQHSKKSQELLNEIAKAMLCLTDPIRKREYDRSLGRVFDDQAEGGSKSLGQALVDDGIATADQLHEAEAFAEARGLSLRDAVVQMKLTDIETATQLYANELGISYIDLNETLPEDSVLDMVPRSLVKTNTFIPLFEDDGMLLIASADEPTDELLDELRMRFGMPSKYALATPRSVNQAIAKYYAPGMREEVAAPPEAETERAEKKTKKKKGKTKAAAKDKKLSSEDMAQRKMVGIIIICWALIGSFLIGQFVLKPLTNMTLLTYVLMVLLGGPTAFWVTQVYWKKK